MSDKKSIVFVFAGPNGSGKSTFTQYFDKTGTYTNADDIVTATGISNQEAALWADKRRYASIEQKEDFSFETVLSSHFKLDILRKAKSAGYFIKCIFVLTIDPKINISRVMARVASGGHNVHREKIVSRYYKTLDNIKELLELCDILHVYDNSVTPVRIIKKHMDDIYVFPNDIWTQEKILALLN